MLNRAVRNPSGESDSRTYFSYEKRRLQLLCLLTISIAIYQLAIAATVAGRYVMAVIIAAMLCVFVRVHHSFGITVSDDSIVFHDLMRTREIRMSNIASARSEVVRLTLGDRTVFRLDYRDGRHECFDVLNGSVDSGSPSRQVVDAAVADINRRVVMRGSDSGLGNEPQSNPED